MLSCCSTFRGASMLATCAGVLATQRCGCALGSKTWLVTSQELGITAQTLTSPQRAAYSVHNTAAWAQAAPNRLLSPCRGQRHSPLRAAPCHPHQSGGPRRGQGPYLHAVHHIGEQRADILSNGHRSNDLQGRQAQGALAAL